MAHLAHKHGNPSTGKLPDRPGVLIQIAAGKALIRAVEKGKVAFLCHDVGDYAPLVSCWVHPCWVMCAGVEDHDRSAGSIVKRGEESSKIQLVCKVGGGKILRLSAASVTQILRVVSWTSRAGHTCHDCGESQDLFPPTLTRL